MDKTAKIYVAGERTLIGAALVRQLRQQGYANILTELKGTEYVFLAGGMSAGIRGNQKHPATLMLDNLQIATEVIVAAHRYGVKKLLYLASSCCYPKLCPQPMKPESLLTGPLEPTSEAYALAKIAGIKLCEAYRREHGANFIPAIPADIFGPGEELDLEDLHVVPALIQRMHDAKQSGAAIVEIWGTGKPRREFIFADDAADACIFAMREYNEAGLINLGGGTDLSIGELAQLIKEIVGYGGELRFDTSKPDGMPFKALDSSKLLSLGWRPKTPLKSALATTYQWMLQRRA